ncbi:hypothetical protein BO71DRAFT_43656 [Aspergillus ellipticus CBS 707.79]|uniref:Uncharacterized protein n=1 Tax=Aspergillus ellipticus CBS 707.79 TaxID=1448320 RepID=A0A319D336_9EURO|nr:hypothetical protein BO71DRAFT_43656 [Aspergillus ellipticus CBS 707.79]
MGRFYSLLFPLFPMSSFFFSPSPGCYCYYVLPARDPSLLASVPSKSIAKSSNCRGVSIGCLSRGFFRLVFGPRTVCEKNSTITDRGKKGSKRVRRVEREKKKKRNVGQARVDRDYGVETGTAEVAVWSGEVRAPYCCWQSVR